MGCDIHAYIEWLRPFPSEEGTKERWWCVAKLSIMRNYRLFALAAKVRMHDSFMQRRQLLEVLEKHGVVDGNVDALPKEKHQTLIEDMEKCDGNTGITMGQEPFEPKGIPKPLSWRVESEYTLYVVDEDPDDESCSRESAEQWVERKISEWWDEDKGSVTHPDWHTPSWLSTTEVEQLLERMTAAQRACIPAAKKQQEEMIKLAREYEEENPEKTARKDFQSWEFHDPMRDEALMELRGILGMMKGLEEQGATARLVFWFDN
jgi:hypothetical protein